MTIEKIKLGSLLALAGTSGLGTMTAVAQENNSPSTSKPNIILMMADDLGWGNVGYNGDKIIKTPHLDQMANEGVRFDRFYSSSPVCSPTRGSCLTGRHPFRYGIIYAMSGMLEKKETTIMSILKKSGYTTGHFGKWHLGTLSKKVGDQNRWGGFGKNPAIYYCPPWERDVDVCFVTESKVPTWDPMKTSKFGKGGSKGITADRFGNDYFTGEGQIVTENLEGDDSRVLMDRAIPFIQDAVKEKKPFFSVIWFHAPHEPVVAGPKFLEMYKGQPEEDQHYYGCITALDEQVGRLRAELEKLGVSDNTMIWFCSDNGPTSNNSKGRSTGGLSGCKRSLREGGVRVPGLMVWPDKFKTPRIITAPATTSDYVPTILACLGIPSVNLNCDGINMLPLIEQKVSNRNKPIGFLSQNQHAWIGEQYKIYSKNGKNFQLYNLVKDRAESRDLSAEFPEIKARMIKELTDWKVGVMADMSKCKAVIAKGSK